MSINKDSGELSVITPPDHEAAATINCQAAVTDSALHKTTIKVMEFEFGASMNIY